MKPLVITGEVKLMFEREAELRAQLTSYKRIAADTGLTTNYVAQVICRMVRAKRRQVKVIVCE